MIENPEIETTVVVLCPDCLPWQIRYVKHKLRANDLEIIESRRVLITPAVVKKIFPDKNGVLFDVIQNHLCTEPLLVFHVEGKNAVKKVVTLVGPPIADIPHTIRPFQKKTSLREKFVARRGHRIEHLPDNSIYFRDYFLRPRDQSEAHFHIRTFFSDNLKWFPE